LSLDQILTVSVGVGFADAVVQLSWVVWIGDSHVIVVPLTVVVRVIAGNDTTDVLRVSAVIDVVKSASVTDVVTVISAVDVVTVVSVVDVVAVISVVDVATVVSSAQTSASWAVASSESRHKPKRILNNMMLSCSLFDRIRSTLLSGRSREMRSRRAWTTRACEGIVTAILCCNSPYCCPGRTCTCPNPLLLVLQDASCEFALPNSVAFARRSYMPARHPDTNLMASYSHS
jgi:hypothetical protein